MPEISVLMPVYNCEAFVKESIDSILKQTFADFEFLIIDDASTDRTVEIIKSYKDDRIRLFLKPANTGISDSLNLGIGQAIGKYLARMDADDISFEKRFEVQYEFLENNPETLVVGSHYEILGSRLIFKLPVTCEDVAITALMNVPVAHPTVLMRREIFTRHGLGYDRNFEPAEDYDLWCKILEIGKIENINEVLLFYRHHARQETKIKQEKILQVARKTRLSQLQKLIEFTGKQYDHLFAIDVLTGNLTDVRKTTLKKIRILIDELYTGNRNNRIYNQNLFQFFLKGIWDHYLHLFNPSKVGDIIFLFSGNSSPVTQLNHKVGIRKLFLVFRLKSRKLL